MQRLKFLLAAAGIALSVSGAALAQAPGELDPTFGLEAGLTATVLPAAARATDVVALADGGWVVSGFLEVQEGSEHKARPVLTRYRANGAPLTSFGVNGAAISAASVVLGDQPTVLFDGIRLYQVVVDSPLIRVLAYTLQGVPDVTYGVGGVATIKVGGIKIASHDAVLQAGRVLIASGGHDGISPQATQFVLARFTPSGQPDATFGTDGMRFSNIAGSSAGTHHILTGVTLQPDGKIVAAGYTSVPPAYEADLVVARFLSNGKVDDTFADAGFRVFNILDRDWSGEVVVQSDGKVLVASSTCSEGDGVTASQFCMIGAARLLPNGNFDVGFGAGGRAMHWLPPIDGQPADTTISSYDVSLDPQGRLVFVGTAWGDKLSGYIARLTSDGSLDSTFGAGGVVRDLYSEFGSTAAAGQLLSLPSGARRLVTVGTRGAQMVIARHIYDDSTTSAATK